MDYRRITKIQYKGEKLKIEWEDYRNGHFDKKSIETKTEPHPDLVNALRALDEPICIEAELPKTEEEYKRHDIQLVKIAYEEDDAGNHIMGCSITSERFMAEAPEPMKITSPFKKESCEQKMPLQSETIEAVDKLIAEAILFLDGKRHDLFAMTTQQMDAVGN
jgi:hypothetical protein